jgi:signal transduction histidine kinase
MIRSIQRTIERLPSKRLRLYARVLLGMCAVDCALGIGLLGAGDTFIGCVFLAIVLGFAGICAPLLFTGHHTLSRILTPYWAMVVLFVAGSYYGPAMNLQYTMFIGAIYPFIAFSMEERWGVALSIPVPLIFFFALEITQYRFLLDHFGLAAHGAPVLQYSYLAMPLAAFLIITLCYFLFSEQSARYERKLQQAVKELELARTHDRLLNQELNNLLRTISHDVANPLYTSMMNAEILLNGPAADQSNALRRIIKANDIIKSIIAGVGAIRAVKENADEFKMTDVSLPAVFDECVATLEERLKEKNIVLEVQSDDWVKTNRVKADKVLLTYNVLANLLTNAIKFSARGDKIILAAARVNDSHVQILVTDKGIGIPPEVRPKLFDPTVNRSRTGTENERGVGYGLPIVKNYVDLMGGQLLIKSVTREESSDGHGTQVEILLKAD